MNSSPTANGSANEKPVSAASSPVNYPVSGAPGSGAGTSGPSGAGGSGSFGSGASGPLGVSGATGPGTGSAGTVGVSGTTGPDGVGRRRDLERRWHPGGLPAVTARGTRPAGTVSGVPAAKRMEVEVEGRRLSLSNLDKVFYPATGFTKGQVIEYYTRIAPVLLPHLRGRHLTLKRYPDGVEGPFFYEKQCPGHRPDWVRTAGVYSRQNGREHRLLPGRRPGHDRVAGEPRRPRDAHAARARRSRRRQPTMLAFDLDPGPPATIVECAEVACRLRDAFDHFGLIAFPKTSGSKGMQLYVPLNTPTSYRATKPFAQGVAQVLERRHPELVVSEMRKDLRPGQGVHRLEPERRAQDDGLASTRCARASARPSRPR